MAGAPGLLLHNAGSLYFTASDGKAVFLEGDNTWTNNISFANDGNFNFGQYLDYIQNSAGANYVRYWMWAGTSYPGQNPGGPSGQARLQPFAQLSNGKWDLSRFNQAYFDHVASDVDAAAAKGMYVSVMAFFDYDPNNYGWSTSVWNGNNNVNGTTTSYVNAEQSDPTTLKYQEAYLAKLLDTLGHKSNVLYEIANEPQNSQSTTNWENTLVNFIKSYQQAHGLLAQPVGLSANYPEGDQSRINTMINATNADWVSPNGQDGEYRDSSPDATGNKVDILDTDHVFGQGGDANWVWRQFTRGAGGVNIMDSFDYSGLPGLFPSTGAFAASNASTRLGEKEIAAVLKQVDITTMKPRDGIASSGYALVDASRGEYVVLDQWDGSVTVDLGGSAGMTMAGEWIDVVTGTISPTFAVAGGNTAQNFVRPNGDSGVLVLMPGGAPPPPLAPVVLGAGPDTLTLAMSEDAYNGDAAFTISVDGAQIGGTQTAVASHGAGNTQIFDVKGNFAAGSHTVSVAFLNDAYGGTSGTDRNLYLTGAIFNGAQIASSNLSLYSSGSQSFAFDKPATPVPPVPPASVVVGSGSNTLALSVSEDAYLGDAQFTVSVDGRQIGGTLTAGASHGAGQMQTFAIMGDFGVGSHAADITFLNDAYGGTASTDRNLYVNGATIDGSTVPASTLTMQSGGTQSFPFFEAPSASPAPVTLGSGSSTLALSVSEDAYRGDAQFTISVDNKQIGGIQTATATHAAGQTQLFNVLGNFAAGSHDVSINFLNDAYDGTSLTDRNLYVDGATINGAAVPSSKLTLLSGALRTFITW